MREFLYRAKGKEGEGWRVGYYWKTDEITYCTREEYENNSENTQHYLLFDQMVDWGLPNRRFKMDIIPDTVCRFTEMLDIKGKRIFENDIVQAHGSQKELYQVCFGEFEIIGMETDTTLDIVVGWHLKTIKTVASEPKLFGYDAPLNGKWIKSYELEIIGNIFDNPELSVSKIECVEEKLQDGGCTENEGADTV